MPLRYVYFLILSICLLAACQPKSDPLTKHEGILITGKGALLTTRFQSLEDFEDVVQVEYSEKEGDWVKLFHSSNGQTVESVLEKGVSEADIVAASEGTFLDKATLCLRSPFFVAHRFELLGVYTLAKRKQLIFGEGDITFYDVAVRMMRHIEAEDRASLDSLDLTEKGFINTFNHVNSQALMTSLFSEELADFVADVHERKTMPELITGNFTQTQKDDILFGAVDNYVDIINNEWGQELGKRLATKYSISGQTMWTAHLLANYLNDLQDHYTWAFDLSFEPFRSEDQLIIRFVEKINHVMQDPASLN